MSSSLRLNRLCNDAYLNDDKSAIYDAFFDYQKVNCLHPMTVEVFDAHTQTKRKILTSCGSCWHCKQTKINEWTTRMYAHCEDFKHVYFVTLTYASFYRTDSPISRLLIKKLGDAVWVRDARNFTHRMCYNPSILVKKHYQDFMKRLRKNTGNDTITYVCSGEYGHDFGRPHFHLILFSDVPISREDVRRAWSVSLVHTKKDGIDTWSYRKAHRSGDFHDVAIGRIDFNDLVTNGTFNTDMKIRVDGRYMNAGNCFSYVCKYVCKQDDANFSRVSLAFDNLYKKETYVKVFDNEVVFDKVREYLQNVGYSIHQIDNITNTQKLISYEKPIFHVSDRVFSSDLSRYCTKKVKGYEFREDFYPPYYQDFRYKFRPFCEFSRGTPIGSVYAKRNIQEFTQNVYSKPILQVDGFVVPSYFRRKAKEFLYPLRASRSTRSGIAFNLEGLPNLYRRFSERNKDGSLQIDNLSYKGVRLDDQQTLRYPGKVFKHAYTGERILLQDGLARFFKFSKHFRKFLPTREMSVSDFACSCCDYIISEITRHNNLLSIAKHNLSALERSQLIALDFGIDSNDLSDNYNKRFNDWRVQHQRIYHELHNSVE